MSNIFNNIKVLTDLEVRNTATMKTGAIISGSHSGSTGLTVKQDAIIEGQLTVGGNVVNTGYAQIGALVVDGLADISGSLIVDGSGSFSQQLYTADRLIVDGVATFNGPISGAAGLDIVGNIKASGDLSGSTGHIGNLTAGSITVDSLYLPGQFGVSGSAQLGQNSNSIITVAGQLSASAGIEVTTGGFNAANGTGYKLKGQEALRANPTNITLQSGSQSKVQLGNLGYGGGMFGQEGIKVFSKDATAIVGPRLFASLGDGLANQLDITGSYSKLYSTAGDVLLSGSTGIYAESDLVAEKLLSLSGSADFIKIPVQRDVQGLYSVDAAIRALDEKINESNINYTSSRYLDSDNFDSEGVKTFISTFLIGDIEQVSVDVLVQPDGTGPWINDLVSVQVKAGGVDDAYVVFEVSAPAMGALDRVRIIAVKEGGPLV